jgi:HEAT repeat protein
MLTVLIILCIVLASLSALAYLLLILGRAVSLRREREEAMAINAWKEKLLAALYEQADRDSRERHWLMVAGNMLINQIEGGDRDRLVALLASTGARDRLIRQLATGNRHAREDAAEALAFYQDELARQALWRAMNDRTHSVRFQAARALIRMKAVEDIQALLLKLDPADNASLLVADLLLQLPPEQLASTASLLNQPVGEGLVIQLIQLYGEKHLTETGPAVLATLDHPDARVREAAWRTLGKLETPLERNTVLRGLNDLDPEVSAMAVEYVGRMKAVDYLDDVTALLEHPNWWVGFRAAEALYSLGETGRKVLRASVIGGVATAADVARRVLLEYEPETQPGGAH